MTFPFLWWVRSGGARHHVFRRRDRFGMIGLAISRRQMLVKFPARFHVALRLREQVSGFLRPAFRQHLETVFQVEVLLDLLARRLRIELQGILTVHRASRMVAVQQPLARVYGGL